MRSTVFTPQVQVTLAATIRCGAAGPYPVGAGRRRSRGAEGRAA